MTWRREERGETGGGRSDKGIDRQMEGKGRAEGRRGNVREKPDPLQNQNCLQITGDTSERQSFIRTMTMEISP